MSSANRSSKMKTSTRPVAKTNRRTQARADRVRRHRRRIAAAITAVAVVATSAVLLSLSLTGSPTHLDASSRMPTVSTEPFQPGSQATLSDTPPPWPVPSDARPFIAAAGLQVLGQESLAVHYHAHLHVLVNGSPVAVPAGVGFVIANGKETGITVLHTHDRSGIIHIESPTNSDYTLGQFVTAWGIRLSRTELGGFTGNAGRTLRAYVDGRLFSGDPASIVLRSHQEIVLWYGPASEKPTVPSSYAFAPGE